jgi:hypothetical protein
LIFQFAHFSFGIKMRSNTANHFKRADAVGDGHNGIAVDSLARGPGAPLAIDRARGVDENAVEVEKNCSADKSTHSIHFYHGGTETLRRGGSKDRPRRRSVAEVMKPDGD